MVSSCGLFDKSQTEEKYEVVTEKSIFPEPIGYVNDFENILTQEEEIELTNIIKEHEAKTTDQISIVTLKSIEPYKSIDDYSLNLANYWGVGQKEKNNGVLIALGKNLRKIRIQNGYGIVERLTDEETKEIIDKIMIPKFKTDDYYQGILEGTNAIIEELNK
jgi:uncharacterized protein